MALLAMTLLMITVATAPLANTVRTAARATVAFIPVVMFATQIPVPVQAARQQQALIARPTTPKYAIPVSRVSMLAEIRARTPTPISLSAQAT